MGDLKDQANDIFQAVQPHIDPVDCEVGFVVLENMHSSEALAPGANDVNRVIALMAVQCRKLADGTDVVLFVVSITGITTDFGSLVLFIKDLVERRSMKVTLYFWTNNLEDPSQLCRRKSTCPRHQTPRD